MADKKQRTPDIFLCHSSKDKEFVRKLARDLHDLLIYSWFDEWELAPGDSLHELIGKALEQSSYVGVILSPDSIKSAWCKKELNQALSRETRTGKKIVIPLRCKGVQIPAFLEDKLYVDFTEEYFVGLCRLAGHIHGVNQRKLLQALSSLEPSDSSQVIDVLRQAGWKNEILIPSQKWRALVKYLETFDVKVRGGRFSIEDYQGRTNLRE
jgi:hypothetical protein